MAFRIIPTRLHAILDYVLGVVIAVLPHIWGVANRSVLEVVPAILGLGLICYSLCTNYELAVFRLIPVRVHLTLDAVGGVVLVGLALAFSAGSGIWVALLVLGMLEIAASLLTETAPSDELGEAAPGVLTWTARSTRVMTEAEGPRTSYGGPGYATPLLKTRTVEQLRALIDSGRTRDKIAMVDPAAAPLGSDDEAGALHDEEGLRRAREQSTRR